jgi:hypothetical protein
VGNFLFSQDRINTLVVALILNDIGEVGNERETKVLIGCGIPPSAK